MPTPAERQALLFVAAVAALGLGVRAWRAVGAPAADQRARGALAAQIAQVDSAIATRNATVNASGGRRGPPRGGRKAPASETSPSARTAAPRTADEPVVPSGPVDVDRAGVEELDRLPGIGPALAARIVEDRERHGPFGSFEALDRVRGIGPSLAERLRPHVTFSSPPRPPDTEAPAGGTARRSRRP